MWYVFIKPNVCTYSIPYINYTFIQSKSKLNLNALGVRKWIGRCYNNDYCRHSISLISSHILIRTFNNRFLFSSLTIYSYITIYQQHNDKATLYDDKGCNLIITHSLLYVFHMFK